MSGVQRWHHFAGRLPAPAPAGRDQQRSAAHWLAVAVLRTLAAACGLPRVPAALQAGAPGGAAAAPAGHAERQGWLALLPPRPLLSTLRA